jgi:hypothetical protein
LKPQQPVCFAAGRQSAKVLNPASDSRLEDKRKRKAPSSYEEGAFLFLKKDGAY